MSLSIHLEYQQQIYFNDNDNLRNVVDNLPKTTHLYAFYKINEKFPDGFNSQIKYVDFPSYFSYNVSSNKLKLRTHQPSVKTETIGRIPLISPDSGDIFYLRMLLTNDHCKGVKNENELRTINGII